MQRPFLPILILVCYYGATANTWQQSGLPKTDEPPGQVNTSASGRLILDFVNQRRLEAPPKVERSGSSQIEPNKPPMELRPSALAQQGTSLFRASPAESHVTTVPSGWFRKTVYAWSAGDYPLLAHQVRTAFWKGLPWGLFALGLLLSAYLERRRRRGPIAQSPLR